MSEFNRSRHPEPGPVPDGEHAGDDCPPRANPFPADFSEEERIFAEALRSRFAFEREELPPLFVQTLIEDELRSPTVPGFEARTTYRVFRRLGLPQPPLRGGDGAPTARWRVLRSSAQRLRRPLASMVGLLLVLVIASVVVATPSFAAGLRLLLGHTGVQQVGSYPTTARPSRQVAVTPSAETPPTNLQWLGPIVGNYAFEGAQVGNPEQWSQGSVVNLHYGLMGQGKGSGSLDIREFQVSPSYVAVLQVVQAGSARLETVNGRPAVYIDGTWVPANIHLDPQSANPYIWESGLRSELLLERDGIILWISADQRDGMTEHTLSSLAAQLTPTNLQTLNGARGSMRHVSDMLARSFAPQHPMPTTREIYQLVPVGSAVDSGVGAFVASDNG